MLFFTRPHVQGEDISTFTLLTLVTMVKKEQKIISSDTRDENVGEEEVMGYLRW